MHNQSLITNFLYTNNLLGIVIGVITFLIIGLFHPLVIKAEYYIGVKSWWIFLFMGISALLSTIWVKDVLYSSALGVFAFSSLWSIKEIFEQQERVRKGWFPKNPKKSICEG